MSYCQHRKYSRHEHRENYMNSRSIMRKRKRSNDQSLTVYESPQY